VVRGAITGAATTFGGIFHSLPFIISNVTRALAVAGIVVAIELFVIALARGCRTNSRRCKNVITRSDPVARRRGAGCESAKRSLSK
jgi:VIT1/CCC1 family predicted Fe2+/Mn2+ transporter